MSDADLTALVVMLRQIQCEPASFDTYSMASAAERAADAIERLRSPGGASDKFKGCVTCGSTEYPHDCNAPEPSERQPDGYAYRYPDGYIRFSGGREVNGSDPVETIPYYFRRAPEPGDKARLMEYAVAAGDCIVAGVPQWRDGWAIISRVQTAPPNERWMLHDADEREKESRAEAEQLALVNTGMDFAVVPIKWRTPTKSEKP